MHQCCCGFRQLERSSPGLQPERENMIVVVAVAAPSVEKSIVSTAAPALAEGLCTVAHPAAGQIDNRQTLSEASASAAAAVAAAVALAA